MLGPHVEQRGSNITAERLRFDFTHGDRLTPEQLAAVEALVNAQIARDLPVSWAEMSVAGGAEAGRHRPVRRPLRRAGEGLYASATSAGRSAAGRMSSTPARWATSASCRRRRSARACAASARCWTSDQ